MGNLYVVPTPIGNLQDITLRALEVLKRVDLIAAEDTRHTRQLLKHFEIEKPLVSYHEHNELVRIDEILKATKEGDVALVSDAGSPGISDPGYKLVKTAIERDIEVIPLPGPTALIPALVASGLPTDSFTFLGFLPKKSAGRKTILETVKDTTTTIIVYESPYRIVETLKDIHEVLGNRNISVSRELTKQFESIYRLPVIEAIQLFTQLDLPGEMVVVIEGLTRKSGNWSEEEVKAELDKKRSEGLSLNQASKEIAKVSGWGKSKIYDLGLEKNAD